jgi:hypothetical protein
MLYLAMVTLTLFLTDLIKQLLHNLSPEYGLKKKASLRSQILQGVCALPLAFSTFNLFQAHMPVEENNLKAKFNTSRFYKCKRVFKATDT